MDVSLCSILFLGTKAYSPKNSIYCYKFTIRAAVQFTMNDYCSLNDTSLMFQFCRKLISAILSPNLNALIIKLAKL